MSTPETLLAGWGDVWRITWRLLTFRASHAELRKIGTDGRYLAFGLVCTWLAGIGRSWDNAEAEFLRQTGLGSVAYILFLALFLWVIVRPLRPRNWSYQGVLTFVALTSPPAFLYALPVEKWMIPEAAAQANLVFLALVAAWRVALLLFYLSRLARLGGLTAAIATLLPLSIIVTVLGAIHVADRTFTAMGGIRADAAQDPSLRIVEMITQLSFIAIFPLVAAYAVLCAQPRHTEL